MAKKVFYIENKRKPSPLKKRFYNLEGIESKGYKAYGRAKNLRKNGFDARVKIRKNFLGKKTYNIYKRKR